MNVCGIDPGFSGAIAIIGHSGMIEHYRKMPVLKFKDGKKVHKLIDIATVAAIFAKYEPSHVFLEKAHAMPRQGVVSMFNYGVGYGMILGVCMALEAMMQTHTITPQKWQKFMYANMIGVDELEPKARAMARFYEIWPELMAQNVTHDGIIDAMLIAEMGRRSLGLH